MSNIIYALSKKNFDRIITKYTIFRYQIVCIFDFLKLK